MSQLKDEPPTDNEKNELFPLTCNMTELAFPTFNYGREKRFEGMCFMESHASLFHTICSIIKSCKSSAEYDQIQMTSQIYQGVPQNDNIVEEDSISIKSIQGGPVLTEDRQEDTQVGPILAEDGQVGPVWAEDEKVVPVLDEDEHVDRVLSKDEQVDYILAKEGQVGAVLAEGGQLDPVWAEDVHVGRVLSKDEQVGQVLPKSEQVDPVMAEDGQVGPLLVEDGRGGSVVTEDEQKHLVLPKEGQEAPVLAEEGQESPILAKEHPILDEDTQKYKDLCKSIHSRQLLASKYDSTIARRQQILSHEELSPAQMIPYMVLINRSIPLPISIIQSLCLERRILCRLHCFMLRCKKKKLLPQPALAKQLIPKVQTDQDFVTFDNLKNLQWKLYKGIVKRKPKSMAVQIKANYSIGKTAAPCPRDAVYMLPLVPKNWITDESLE